MTEPYHYAVIGRALAEIDRAPGLSLDALAARMDMSAAHFQRVFSAWVGVSPKRYQQYLVLGHARSLLQQRMTLLQAAQETGLSGTSRLHDMFLRWEAMSPGEYALGGAGLTIGWAVADSPFGQALVMATPRGICGIGFIDDAGFDTVMEDLTRRWPRATYVSDPAVAALMTQPEVPLHLIGAPFQIKVWEALLRIPTGHVTTYSNVAQAIGNPGAVRAVGTAIGRNPVSWLIPCHRALRKSGELGGYHWGLPRKRAMLAWEGARHDAHRREPAEPPAELSASDAR